MKTSQVAMGLTMALVVTACGSVAADNDQGGLATLEEPTEQAVADEAGMSDEEAVLAFADCMRDNGLPDFQDPIVEADGSIVFAGAPGGGGGEEGDFRAAIEACEDILGGTTFTGGRGGDFDPVELQDDLLALAACLRDNGLDVDDPDISEGFGGNRDEGDAEGATPLRGPASLFGDRIDLDDPETQEIFESCADEVNLTPPGGGAGRGGGA